MQACIPRYLRPVAGSDLVRLGDVLDGGYVVSQELLLASEALVSMGVSTNWEFEKAFLQRRKALGRDLTIHAYDHSVNSGVLRIYRLKSAARYCLTFDRKYLARCRMASGFARFFDGRQATHFKEKVWSRDEDGCVGIATILSRIPPDRRVFVKMDIEGSE